MVARIIIIIIIKLHFECRIQDWRSGMPQRLVIRCNSTARPCRIQRIISGSFPVERIFFSTSSETRLSISAAQRCWEKMQMLHNCAPCNRHTAEQGSVTLWQCRVTQYGNLFFPHHPSQCTTQQCPTALSEEFPAVLECRMQSFPISVSERNRGSSDVLSCGP